MCCKYGRMQTVDPIKQDMGTALAVRAAAIPRESRRGLEKPPQPICLSVLTDTHVSSGAVARLVDSTSVATGWAVSTSLSSLHWRKVAGSGDLGSNPTPATSL